MQPKMHLLSTNFTLTVGMLYRCPQSSFQSYGGRVDTFVDLLCSLYE